MKHFRTQKTGVLTSMVASMMAVLLLSAGAAADQNYGGILAGKSEVDVTVKGLNGASYDKTSSAHSIFMGREFDDEYSIEMFHTNLGTSKLRSLAGGSYIHEGETVVIDADFSASLKVRSYGVAAKYYVDLRERTRMSLKLGMHKWSAKMAARIPGISTAIKYDGTDAMGGIGVEYEADKNTVLMAGVDSYAADKDTISMTYLGLRFNFD